MQVREQSGAPAVAPFGGQHDQVQGVHRLHLQPVLAAPAGRVRRVQGLDDHALVAAAQRLGPELHGLGLLGRRVPHLQAADPGALGHEGGEGRVPLADREVEQGVVAGGQDVEEIGDDRQGPAGGGHVHPGADPARDLLEGDGAAVRALPDDLPVEDEPLPRQ